MFPNRLRQLWQTNQTVVNGWLTIPSAWTAELMAQAGFDALTIDAQHGLATDLTTILPMLQAMAASPVVPLVRVPWNDPATHMRMLDAGVAGIICPMINNRAEAEAFVQACRYPPQGYRSYGPLRAGLLGGSTYFELANQEVLTLAMIETAEGLKNIEEIAQTPTLDGFYVGPWDLSLSAGLGTMGDFRNPALLRALDRVLEVAARYGLYTGIHCNAPDVAIQMAERGFQLVTSATDTHLLRGAAAANVQSVRGTFDGRKSGI
ncbi:aldolase/citrate lyase family protein [Rhabdobacter roseus]|uniref:4-hydroxy-2-oxoheptanedioate aldolase n=1 Tax=Rhabdobacter roseus TaxID=1655419 RepID=A0A840U4L9_9BACT|nr:aldolase/citrate lyase family protein [Rhabdobacter roseus]MBB5286769.1 4-hydroxy-2-oxoheptanedioate aldolase [Rhabdobacter roseus]